MAAHDDATVTIDTNEMTYIDRHEHAHVVTNAETFIMELALNADASSEDYTVSASGGSLALATGETLTFEADPVFSKFTVATDAAATTNAGSIWFRETDGYRAEWKIRTITIDNIDEPTVITAATFERVDNPMVTMTYTTVTVAQ